MEDRSMFNLGNITPSQALIKSDDAPLTAFEQALITKNDELHKFTIDAIFGTGETNPAYDVTIGSIRSAIRAKIREFYGEPKIIVGVEYAGANVRRALSVEEFRNARFSIADAKVNECLAEIAYFSAP